MRINPFDFNHYKGFVREKITHESKHDRSFRKRLTEFVRCQPSYLSQVIHGKPDFTLEQAHRLSQFLSLNKDESRFFILQVEEARAGSVELRQFFTDQLMELKKNRVNLKKGMKDTESVTEEARHKYYSAWFFSAIYVALSIPELQSVQKLAVRFNLPESLVSETIDFLEGCGLVEVVGDKYAITQKRLHLDWNSLFIQRHHINWRSQSLQSVEKNLSGDLHYSSVIALSKADFDVVKDIFSKSIVEARAVIKDSPEEELVAITLDCFRL